MLEFPLLGLYMSTKTGMERFTQTLKRELDDDGIRVSVVRAGPMFEEGKEAPSWDPAAAQMFYERCMANGINLMQRGVSQVASVTEIFRLLVDLPADVKVNLVTLEGRIP